MKKSVTYIVAGCASLALLIIVTMAARERFIVQELLASLQDPHPTPQGWIEPFELRISRAADRVVAADLEEEALRELVPMLQQRPFECGNALYAILCLDTAGPELAAALFSMTQDATLLPQTRQDAAYVLAAVDPVAASRPRPPSRAWIRPDEPLIFRRGHRGVSAR